MMSLLAWLLETAIGQMFSSWWNRNKTQGAIDAENKVAGYDDEHVIEQLRDKWTKH